MMALGHMAEDWEWEAIKVITVIMIRFLVCC